MNAFIVPVENRPGEIARVTGPLAARGINILVCCLVADDQAALGLVANDEEATRSTLRDAGIGFREIPVFTVRMEDRPGQTASTSRRLADAGVNIELWLPVDTTPDNFIVAVGVDNVEAARQALSEQLTTWSYL